MAKFDKELAELFGKTFKGDAKISRVSEDLRGKTICIYGGNDLGKTKQASKLPNPIFIPCEQGLNSINGAMVLKTNSWSQFTKHIRKLSDKKFTSLLDKGVEMTLIIDGVDSLGKYCQDFICSKYGVTDISEGSGDSKVNLYSMYEKLYWKSINKVTLLGYTVVFINHDAMDKELGKLSLSGDKRCTKPIKDNCDITVHLVSNGVDENNEAIPSSAYLRETEDAFARCRFTHVVDYLEVFTADNLMNAIKEGIKKQNKEEGFDSVDFKEQQEIYYNNETFESVVEEIKELFYKLSDMDENSDEQLHLQKYDEIVSDILGEEVQISQCTEKNFEALRVVRDNLEEYIESL
ncbi:AAA family ATPase [Clostridium botulinum]|uniref:AAA family ATPase n=1 Tax=Clostridium botulinum TaxID=1491 RepID=UPI001967F40F|nr:AAA family ATPase [Clostridium botulinum]